MLNPGKHPESHMPYVPTYSRYSTYFLVLTYCMHERQSTARNSSAAKTMKMRSKISERKTTPRPLSCNHSSLIEAPCTGRNLKTNQSFSLGLVRRPPSRPPRHRLGPDQAFLPLCHSEPCRPPRVKPGSHRGPPSPARHFLCSDLVALSATFSLVAKIRTA